MEASRRAGFLVASVKLLLILHVPNQFYIMQKFAVYIHLKCRLASLSSVVESFVPRGSSWRYCFPACFLFFFFLAALGLRCCARAFSSCSERGLLFVAVCGLLIAVVSLVAEHGL